MKENVTGSMVVNIIEKMLGATGAIGAMRDGIDMVGFVWKFPFLFLMALL